MNNLSDKILETLEKKHIAPKSKYVFLLTDILFWVVGVVSLVIGSLAVAVTMFILHGQQWLWLRRVAGPAKIILYVFPYFWFFLFILFILIAYISLRYTARGYKLTLCIAGLVYIVTTLCGGALLYYIGIAPKVEEQLIIHTPWYEHMLLPRQHIMHNPENGLLLGVFETDEDYSYIRDRDNIVWTLDMSEFDMDDIDADEDIHEGMVVHALGKKIKDYVFEVKEIMIPPTPLWRPKEGVQEEMKEKLHQMRSIK